MSPQRDPVSAARWSLAPAAAFLLILVWCAVLLAQPIAPARTPDEPAITRGAVTVFSLLRPEDTWSAWVDGPVTIRGLIDRARVIGLMGFVAVPPIVFGCGLLRRGGLPSPQPAAGSWWLGAALGLAIHSGLVLLAGLTGLLNAWSIALASGLAFVLGTCWLWQASPARTDGVPRDGGTASDGARGRVPVFGRLCLSVGFVLLIGRSLLPPSEFDVREYHLEAPKEWFERGRIDFVPHNLYANMPLAAELHALTAMHAASLFWDSQDAWWWGGLAGKAMMAVYLLITAGLTHQLATRWFSSSASRWVWPLALLWPPLAVNAGLGLNESAVACFVIASAVWLDALWLAGLSRVTAIDLFLAGLFPGAALACKYTSLVLVVLPWLLTVFVKLSQEQPAGLHRPRWWSLGWLMLGLALLPGVWFAKNALLAGNPVYPLLGNVFSGQSLTDEELNRWQAAHDPPATWLDDQGRLSPSLAMRRIRETIGPLTYAWPLQGMALLPLAVLGLCHGHASGRLRLVAGMVLISVVIWWVATHRLERFLMPLLSLMLLLATAGIAQLQQWFPRRWTWLLGVPLAFDVLLLATPAVGDSRIFVDLRSLRRDDRSESSVSRLPPHVPWLNYTWRADHPDARVLLIGDAAVFDYELPIVYATCFDQSPLIEQLDAVGMQQVGRALRADGLTHILVNWSEIDRYRSPGNYGFDARVTPELFRELVEAGQIFEEPLPDSLENRQQLALYRIAE